MAENIILQLQSDLEAAKDLVHKTTIKMTKEREEAEVALKQESHQNVTKVRVEYEMMISTLEETVLKLEEDKIKEIAAIEDESAKTTSSLQLQISDLQKKVMELEAQKENEIIALRKESENERNGLVSEADRKVERIISDHEKQQKTVENKHHETVKSLQLEMETKEKKAIEQIKNNEIELEKKMEQLQLQSKQYLEEQVGTHNKERRKLVKAIEELKEEHANLERHIVQLESKYVDATEEIGEWQKTFSERSYCNFTYIHEDVTTIFQNLGGTVSKTAGPHLATTAKFTREASDAAIKVAEPHIAKVKKLSKEASNAALKAAEPHIAASTELYNRHLKASVDKHIMPLHEKYVNAQLMRGKSMVLQHRENIVQHFKSVCYDLKKELRQSNISPDLKKMIRERCSEPEKLVDAYFYIILFVFVFIFRRSLRRLVVLPFWVLWYFSPLRFILRSTTLKPATVKSKKE